MVGGEGRTVSREPGESYGTASESAYKTRSNEAVPIDMIVCVVSVK